MPPPKKKDYHVKLLSLNLCICHLMFSTTTIGNAISTLPVITALLLAIYIDRADIATSNTFSVFVVRENSRTAVVHYQRNYRNHNYRNFGHLRVTPLMLQNSKNK